MPFHLYLHLPYCRRRCPYCDFYKKVPKAGRLSAFIRTLKMELELAAEHLPWTRTELTTLYFGGGTPSLHSPSELEDVIATVISHWSLAADAEITLETNPGTVDEAKLLAIRKAGINRLSIGAQSFSQRKLQLLYRDHSIADIFSCVKAARAAGFTNLSLDLIFGLPNETRAEWEADLSQALQLSPEHVSLYNLEFHEQTPFYRWKKQGKMTALDEDFEADLYLMTHDLLTAAEYDHYEVSNFARPGFRSRHNRAYWLGSPYLGCGPSAHSYDGQLTRFKNVSDDMAWTRAIEAGELGYEEVWNLSQRDQIEEWISLSLRRSEGIDKSAVAQTFGHELTQKIWTRAETLPPELCELSDQYFRLTPTGWFRENTILAHIFAAL